MNHPLSWSGFYAIVDLGVLGEGDPIEVSRKLLSARPVALQLRAKDAAPREVLPLAVKLAALCQEAHVPFVVNDRADIALLSGAWGVHVGQEDLPLLAVKESFPSLRVGVSTHNLEQVKIALAQGADYLGFGPVFTTSTKKNPDPVVGVELLAQAIMLANETPVVAIGGITRAHIPQLQSARARVVTSIGDVLRSEDPRAAAEAFREALHLIQP